MRNIYYIIILFVLFVSCNKKTDKYETIAFGYYCGECYGNCFVGYILQNDSVYKFADKNVIDIRFDNKTSVDLIEKNKIKDVINLLPPDLTSYDKIIGKPDSHDQCAIYIYTKDKKDKKEIFVDIDDGMHPKQFDKFIAAVLDLRLL